MSPTLQVVLLLLGVACVITGATAYCWPAGLVATGVLILLAVADLAGVDR